MPALADYTKAIDLAPDDPNASPNQVSAYLRRAEFLACDR